MAVRASSTSSRRLCASLSTLLLALPVSCWTEPERPSFRATRPPLRLVAVGKEASELLAALEARVELARADLVRLLPPEAVAGPPLVVRLADGAAVGEHGLTLRAAPRPGAARSLAVDPVVVTSAAGGVEGAAERVLREATAELILWRLEVWARNRAAWSSLFDDEATRPLAVAFQEGLVAFFRVSRARAPEERAARLRGIGLGRAIGRFDETLRRFAAASPGDRLPLAWAAVNGDQPWATEGFRTMFEALSLFEGPAAVRAVIREGPLALIERYGALAGRWARLRDLSAETRALARALLAPSRT